MRIAAEPGLIEREPELATLRELVELALGGAGSLVVIQGEAGIGKSALLRACARDARERGLRVLSASGDEVAVDSAFSAARELLGPEVARDRETALDGAAALATPVFEGAEGGLDTTSVVYGLYWLVANVAEHTPIAVLIDDVHWLDPASRRFVSYLAARIGSMPALAVLAARTGEGAPVAGLEQAIVVRPAPLSEDGSGELVRGLLGPRADERLCRSCHQATGGNPFYLQELTRAIDSEGERPTADLAFRVRELGVDSVSRSVLVRLARLGADCEALALALAVLAPRAPLRHVAALARLEHDRAAVAADAMRAAGLLQPAVALSFAHPIVREAIASELPASRAADLHARAAKLLSDEGAPSDEIAAHLLSAEPFGERWVVDALRRAAREALARGAPEAAVAYLGRALSEPPESPDRLEVLIEAGIAETRLPTMDFRRLHEALALATGPKRRAEIALALGAALTSVMQLVAVRELMEEIGAEADALEPEVAEQIEALLLATGIQELSECDRLRPIAERHLARALRGEAIHPVMLVSVAGTEAVSGRPGAGELLRRAVADPRLLASPPIYGAACIVLTYLDELARAGQAVDLALGVAQRSGSAQAFMTVSTWRAMVDYRLGDLVAAEDHARRARELAVELGAPVFALPTLTKILVERDLADEAAEFLRGIDSRQPAVWTWQSAALLADHGQLRVTLGELEEGVADMLEADRRMRTHGWRLSVMTPWVPCAAGALWRLGRRDDAASLARRELEEAVGFGVPRSHGVALSTCGMLDPGDDGLTQLHAAVDVLERSPARVEHARALINLGQGLRQRGEREAAREPLSQGLDLAIRTGARRLATRAREELRAAGARPRRTALTGVEALTPAELRTARLAADGLSNKQIAQALFVSTKTVESQLSQTYRKLAISGRAALASALASQA